jgi:hypothetical protein
MTPEEALEHKRQGGKLNEPISPRDLILFDVDHHFQSRGTVIVMTTIPATNPGQEHGTSNTAYQEALANSRTGRIIQKVIK